MSLTENTKVERWLKTKPKKKKTASKQTRSHYDSSQLRLLSYFPGPETQPKLLSILTLLFGKPLFVSRISLVLLACCFKHLL